MVYLFGEHLRSFIANEFIQVLKLRYSGTAFHNWKYFMLIPKLSTSIYIPPNENQ